MTLVVDNQLPPALARFIQAELNFAAIHVIDIGLRDASDAEVWDYASRTASVLISKDEDFANLALHKPTARLIWLRIGNCRKAYLLELFRRKWPAILELFKDGADVVEVR